MKDTWSRRRFTKAIISAQALIASGALVLPVACKESDKIQGKSPLDKGQQEILKIAMDEIIPANDKMPSASQVGGLNYILNILDELPDLGPLFISLISKIEDQSFQKFDVEFSKINKQQRISVLILLEQSAPELFKVLKDFTYESYYTNESVYELISYESHPTGTSGPKMEAFDDKLLDRVKRSPKLYTKI